MDGSDGLQYKHTVWKRKHCPVPPHSHSAWGHFHLQKPKKYIYISFSKKSSGSITRSTVLYNAGLINVSFIKGRKNSNKKSTWHQSVSINQNKIQTIATWLTPKCCVGKQFKADKSWWLQLCLTKSLSCRDAEKKIRKNCETWKEMRNESLHREMLIVKTL